LESIDTLKNNIKIIQQPLIPTLPFIRWKLLELINQIQIFWMPNDRKFSALYGNGESGKMIAKELNRIPLMIEKQILY